jgi:hypothetical protein
MSFSEDRVRSRDVPSKGKRPDGENNRQPGKPREPGRKRSSPPRQAYSEFAGHRGLDATRYGDWEYSGRCTDF